MIKENQWMDIRSLHEQGMKIKHIADRLNLDRKTVRKHIKATSKPQYRRTVEVVSKLAPCRDYIKERLDKTNLTATRIYEEIKHLGYEGKYSWLAAYVSSIKKEYKNAAVLRFETIPGEQAQVDWGYFGRLYDKQQKRWVELHCFFMILGYSRTLYIEFFERAHLPNFLKGHNNAFKYFGGYTREILYDNLKSVVIKRAMRAEDSDFNKKFMDYAGYYGFKPILCRAYKPNTKGKVENSVNFAKQNFFRGESFSSLEEVNQKAQEWLEKINNRIHCTTKERPVVRLSRETLIKLDNKPMYDCTEIKYRKVFKDCHFSYNANFYSVPYKYANKEVAVKEIDNSEIAVIYRNEEIARHNLILGEKGRYISHPEHFEGLLALRKSHGIRKPRKKANENQENQEIKSFVLSWMTEFPKVVDRSPDYYEEEAKVLCNN